MLIVSGPGTGKSRLFLHRIKHWFHQEPEARILVSSFVRKLVADLQSDIDKDKELTGGQKKQTTVSTLHRIARGIVEKNHGTSDWPFQSYFKIIGQPCKELVWGDVLAFYPLLDREQYKWKNFEDQLHNDHFLPLDGWPQLKPKYFELCQFYNAAGFADLILRARNALEQNTQLNENIFFIVDEYQDFNRAEEVFIESLTEGATGALIAGDDEQVLYEQLKCGEAALIRNHYKDEDLVNAMLPFCGRCSYHITKAAAHFIQKHQDNACINKIFLPLEIDQRTPKVQIIACATPVTAIDYIQKFVDDHKGELDERKTKLASGEKKDAFLLVLTPARDAKFFGKDKAKILEIVTAYRTEPRAFSEDYYKVLNYYSLAGYPHNNFTFRKVLFYESVYENVSDEQVHQYLEEAIESQLDLCDLPYNKIFS